MNAEIIKLRPVISDSVPDDQIQTRRAVWNAAQLKFVKPGNEKTPRRRFVMVPEYWWHKLGEEPHPSGKTFLVVFELFYRAWRLDLDEVELPNERLKQIGVSRQSKYRALTDLQCRGLIRVEWAERKSPLVRLLRHR